MNEESLIRAVQHALEKDCISRAQHEDIVALYKYMIAGLIAWSGILKGVIAKLYSRNNSLGEKVDAAQQAIMDKVVPVLTRFSDWIGRQDGGGQ